MLPGNLWTTVWKHRFCVGTHRTQGKHKCCVGTSGKHRITQVLRRNLWKMQGQHMCCVGTYWTYKKNMFCVGTYGKHKENTHVAWEPIVKKNKTQVWYRNQRKPIRKHRFCIGTYTKVNENTCFAFELIEKTKVKHWFCVRTYGTRMENTCFFMERLEKQRKLWSWVGTDWKRKESKGFAWEPSANIRNIIVLRWHNLKTQWELRFCVGIYGKRKGNIVFWGTYWTRKESTCFALEHIKLKKIKVLHWKL